MTLQLKYEIGQEVWLAKADSVKAWVTCPDCGGTGCIRAMLHDDTMVTIECEGCKLGFNPPIGKVSVYNRTPCAELVTITGFEAEAGRVDYRTSGFYRLSEANLFDNEADATKAAIVLASVFSHEEREQINTKEKPTKSWAWNVSYHRRCIRDAEKQIAYHTSKLNVASLKAKEVIS